MVVSCGTSLPSLLRTNIVPHIHVEMERSKDGYYIKEDYLKSPLLKNTLLITLNTVYHKTLLTFENRLVFLKQMTLQQKLLKKSMQSLRFTTATQLLQIQRYLHL
ncbi:6-hydroxymethylpterin diphosphokinase MptE-like protein [Pseudoalteromonas piscicida]|uniref:6-hydroxymethylpterin diphosphokinase MptE-like protein n=1 Tax=Pseudoalteromonas piscicida TaxID=43662 RepID=UPI003CE5C584